MLCTFTIDDEPFEVEVTGDFSREKTRCSFRKKAALSKIANGQNLVLPRCRSQMTRPSGFERQYLVHPVSILKGNNIPVDEHFSLEHYHW